MGPKPLYGCELAPVNESAVRGLRKEFADAIAFSPTKRSVDFTFAVASYGPGLDPDIQIYVSGVLAFM